MERITTAKLWFVLMAIAALAAVLVIVVLPRVFAATPRVTDLVIIKAAGAPGQMVSAAVNINTQGQLIRGFQFNFAYDGDVLQNGAVELTPFVFPANWLVTSNLAGPGDLRILAVDVGLDGDVPGLKLSGHIFTASFDISPTAPPGDYPITTSLASMGGLSDDPLISNPLTIEVSDGAITVVDLVLNQFIIVGLPPEIISAEVTNEAGERSFQGVAGEMDQLVVTAFFTGGSQQIITDQIEWIVIDPSVASISPTGKITIGAATGSTVAIGVFIE